jgi:hypothetical protein
MMYNKFNEKVDKYKQTYETCQICGSNYHKSGRARHLRTKKCKDADYINNKIFEIKKIKIPSIYNQK